MVVAVMVALVVVPLTTMCSPTVRSLTCPVLMIVSFVDDDVVTVTEEPLLVLTVTVDPLMDSTVPITGRPPLLEPLGGVPC
jgi:hypothetical protein